MDSEDETDYWTSEPLHTDSCSSSNVLLPPRLQRPFVELVPHCDTHPTRVQIFEVCRLYLSDRCYYGDYCRHVHPKSKQQILQAFPNVWTIRVKFISQSNKSMSSPSQPHHLQALPEPRQLEMSPTREPRVNLPCQKNFSVDSSSRQSSRQHNASTPSPDSSRNTHKSGKRHIRTEPKIAEHEVPSEVQEITSLPLSDISNSGGIEWEPHDSVEEWSSSPSSESESSSSGWDYHPSPDDWADSSISQVPASAVPGPRPQTSRRCWQWLRDRCDKGYTCRYIHDDLDYLDEPERPLHPPGFQHPLHPPGLQHPLHPPGLQHPSHQPQQPVPPRMPSSTWALTLHDHIKVKVNAGFEVSEIITGFETPWVFIDHIPCHVTPNDINALLSRFGRITDSKIPTKPIGSFLQTVKIRFSSHNEAREASSNLNGSYHFDATLLAHLPVNTGGRTATFRNTSVRISWEAPGKLGYGGYPTLERAEAAMAECRNGPLRQSFVWATLHRGIPAVDAFTVRFHNLPLDVTKEDMTRFAQPTDMMWDRPNYFSIPKAAEFLKRIIDGEDSELLEFELQSPPYRTGRIIAFAQFSSPNAAKAAAGKLNGRVPKVTGLTKVYATHLQTLRYTVTPELFARRADALTEFQDSVRREHFAANVVIEAPKQTFSNAVVKLSASELKDLGTLKTEFNAVLWGEVLRHAGKNIWDCYFSRPPGAAFLKSLERQVKGVTIVQDFLRRTFTLFGPAKKRQLVRDRILSKIDEIQSAGQVRSISLRRVPMGLFMTQHFARLQRELGPDNLLIDVWDARLNVRGTLADFETATREVRQLESQRYPDFRPGLQCPVCFDNITVPLSLPCGHKYCETCMSNYLLAAIDTRFFPLTCLGNEGRCRDKIPLTVAKKMLTAPDFDRLLETAFKAFIDTHPTEYHHCPTPNCMQIYRSAPPGTVLQCPSCLLRICPQCHAEYHDGLSCPDRDGHDALFHKWAETRDLKYCPSCKIPIERSEGCNHVTCTKCQTHICWECMKTFPRGEGIYGHMRQEHGGFGLAQFEF